jgi:FkbM family methyltransferase
MLVNGTYERPELNLIERFLPRDCPVIELGGSIGVVACFTNRRLDQADKHIVVEAHPQLIPTLQENARLNGCQFKVINAAIAYDAELVTFYTGPSFLAGSVRPTEGTNYRVPATSVSNLLSHFAAPQISLISDIEGSETQFVEREFEALAARVRWLILEIHPDAVGTDGVAQMRTTLARVGFIERARENDVIALENARLANSQ